MKLVTASILSIAISSALVLPAHADSHSGASPLNAVGSVSPALETYTKELLLGEVWERSELSARDRSIATLAALIARDNTAEMAYQMHFALDNGVKAGEISEIITHLAFYSGWGNAMSAVSIAHEVFSERGISQDQLPSANPELLPLDEEAEKARETHVEKVYGGISDGVLKYTTEALFKDLWLRPTLAPRDRSMVTVSALIAAGKIEQVSFHLNKAMDNGLTQPEASELLTHLAFYAGWPNIFSTLPVAKQVFEARSSY